MAKGAGHGAPPLLEALALPLGHLCRFHVLLFQLLRRTDAGHPDYENLEAAVDAVNILIGELDETCTPLVRCRERAAQLQAAGTQLQAAQLQRDPNPNPKPNPNPNPNPNRNPYPNQAAQLQLKGQLAEAHRRRDQ